MEKKNVEYPWELLNITNLFAEKQEKRIDLSVLSFLWQKHKLKTTKEEHVKEKISTSPIIFTKNAPEKR